MNASYFAVFPFLAMTVTAPLGGWLTDRLMLRVGKRTARRIIVMGGETPLPAAAVSGRKGRERLPGHCLPVAGLRPGISGDQLLLDHGHRTHAQPRRDDRGHDEYGNHRSRGFFTHPDSPDQGPVRMAGGLDGGGIFHIGGGHFVDLYRGSGRSRSFEFIQLTPSRFHKYSPLVHLVPLFLSDLLQFFETFSRLVLPDIGRIQTGSLIVAGVNF